MHQDSIASIRRTSFPVARGLLALVLLAAPAYPAANPVFDARGFDPEREFLSELPFEHVDPMTGNLLLTFTDLVLPGNAGFDLRVQRTYNSKIYENYTSGGWVGFREDSWAGIGWSLHFGRVSQFPTQPTAPGPVIEMPDGSQHQAYRHMDMDGGSKHFITRDYWTYEDRNSGPILRLPNGTEYTFGRERNGPRPNEVTHYVTEIRDTFGNRVTVNYAPAPAPADVVASVVQRVGTKTRTVTFAYDPTLSGFATGSLRSMTFDGRTWNYRQQKVPDFTYSALTEVQPPLGPAWRFEYYDRNDSFSGYLLRKLTTPSGGQIEYAYAAQRFNLGSGVIFTPSLSTRTASGPGVANGTWRYQYSSPDWRDPIQSSVTSPCGSSVRYTFKPIGSRSGIEEPWAIGSMISKETFEGGQQLERQVLTWLRSQPISNFPESGSSPQTHVPLLESRTITRAGSAIPYRTSYSYSQVPYNRQRAANFNDHGRAMLIVENGDLLRSTTRSFAYFSGNDPSFGRYIVDRVDAETLTVGLESFTQRFEYVPATGFRRLVNSHGIVTRFEPDGSGNVEVARDANNNATRFTYDWGVVKNTITPEFTITREINNDGTVRTETRRGHTTRFQYDTLGRPTLVSPAIGLATSTEYDNAAARFTRVRRGSSVVTTSLNGFGQVVRSENGLRIAATRGYDTCGRPVYDGYPFYAPGGSGTPAIDTGTTTRFDGLGRVVRRTHPDGPFQTFEHRGIDVTITDEMGRRTLQDRSAFGSPDDDRLVAVTDAEAKTTLYSYNALGSLTRVDAPEGAPSRRWVYNPRGELGSETQPEGGTVNYTYDLAGNLQTRRDEQFGLTTFIYDRNNRLTSIDRLGTAYDTTVGWDASDNRTLVANAYVNSQFEYDAINRLRKRTDVIGARSFAANYTYDDSSAGNGNLKTLGYPTGRSVNYDYDNEGRITAVKSGAKVLADTFRYHASGGVSSFKRGNGIAENVAYDARYRPFEIESGSVLKLRYGYDSVGNVTSVVDSRAGMSLGGLTYDKVDRLLTASGPWGPSSFTYDAVGNRRTRTVGAATTSYGYDSATQRLMSATGADAGSFAYDRNGNLSQDARGSYTHAPTNLMETATVAGQLSTYRYDGDELRKLRSSGGETHYYLHGPGGSLLSELLDKGPLVEPVRDYVYAGTRMIAAIKPSPLVLTPTSLSFTALAQGPSTSTQKVRIETLGASGLAFSATASAPWLTLSAASGATPYNLNIAVNPAALAAGSYTGTVSIVAPLAQGSPKTVAVSVVVVANRELQVTPGSLSFEATTPTAVTSLDTLAPRPTGSAVASNATTRDAVLNVPLTFERNEGQSDSSVEFLARGPGYGLFLTREAVVMGLAPAPGKAPARVSMRFVDASPTPTLVPKDERPGRSHYYRGSDPSLWTKGAPHFGRVEYEQLYPGIDAVFYGNQRQLEYDLVVAPGTQPDRVQLAFDGAQGLRLNADGDLVLEVEGGELVQKKPVVYQGSGDDRREIAGRYRITGESTVAFDIGEYDRSEPLVIDPVLSYFTYLGGAKSLDQGCVVFGRCGKDELTAVIVDAAGATYVAGFTMSTDFPLRGAGEGTAYTGAQDVVVSKLDAAGASLIYSTYIGGSDDEFIGHLAVAPGGNLFLAGATESRDFPTTDDAVQRSFAGPFEDDGSPAWDLILLELGTEGELLFSTYYGGRGNEWVGGLGVDASGAAYIGGSTWSDNLPMRNSLQPGLRGSNDAFVAKFRPSGNSTPFSSLVWSTYFGGSKYDGGAGFAIDASGNGYLAGMTESADLPMVSPLQGSINAGAPVPAPPDNPPSDAFVTRFNSTGTSIPFSTYVGGTGYDWATGLALGAGNVVYLTGSTTSTDFPLHEPLQPYFAGGGTQGHDGFVTSFTEGSGFRYSTYAGTFPFSPRVDALGNLYFLYSARDLVVHPFNAANNATGIAKLAADGSRYLFASPIGGVGDIGLGASALALDGVGNVFLVGSTFTPDLATPGAFQTSIGGETDGYIMKLTGTGGAGGGTSLLQQALLIKDRVLTDGPSWTAFDNVPWLQLSRTSGTGPAIVFADVDTTGLLPGVYNGSITVTASGAVGSPKDVPVTLTIRPNAPQPAQANPGGPYRGQLLPDVELDGSASVDPAGTIASHAWSFDDGTTALGKNVKHVYTTPGNHPVTLTIRGYSGAMATASTNVYINYPVDIRTTAPYAGVVGQPIVFDASQSVDPDGTIVAFQWFFGDGSQGAGPTFPHAYAQAGTYQVSLSAQDDTGYWSNVVIPVTITIPANEPPVARPGGPYTGEPRVAVAFDGSASTDSDGTITAWAWSFGDGQTATGAHALRSFENPGIYDVSLTVTDNFGAQSTAVTQLTVGVFTVTPDHLKFRMFAGGSNPAPQSLDLAFPTPLEWTATSSEPRLTIDASAGTTPDTLGVSFDGSGLEAGTRQATITITPAGVGARPIVVPVELTVEPPAGGCDASAFFCEPFDELLLGNLSGQNGWEGTPEASTSNTVVLDPRPGPDAKVLLLDPDSGLGLQGQERVELTARPLEELEVSLEVMSNGVEQGSISARVDLLGPLGTGGWGVETRAFGSLLVGSSLVFQDAEFSEQTLIQTVDPQRWYTVRFVYRNGRVEVWVDGIPRFLAPMNGIASGIAGLAVTGSDVPGSASVDLIQVMPFVSPPLVGELVAEPAELSFQFNGPTDVVRAQPQAAPDTRMAAAAPAPARAMAPRSLKPLPLEFEANVGQTDPAVRFLARGRGYGLFVTPSETVLALPGRATPVRVRFEGARRDAELRGLDERPGKSHYLVGRDPAGWHRNVPRYARVEAQDLYPGVSAVYYGNEGRVEYDLVVSPGVDPSAVKLGFEGVDSLGLAENGDLVLATGAGEVRQKKPLVYQLVDGERRLVDASYALLDHNRVAFRLGSYDEKLALTIDPTLVYSTFLGGDADDGAQALAVDLEGHAYIGGFTASATFPVTGDSYQQFPAGGLDGFVTKLDLDGAGVVYSTYIGGLDRDIVESLAVDAAGGVFAGGSTYSMDFPLLHPHQATHGGGGRSDGFLLRLDPSGASLSFSTYLGGWLDDTVAGLAMGPDGRVAATGQASQGFPFTVFPFWSWYDYYAAFAARFDPNGAPAFVAPVGERFGPQTSGFGVAVDAANNTWITGWTRSPGLATPDAFQSVLKESGDAFVSKLSPTGTLVYSTYLGGLGGDMGHGIAVDASGVSVTGATSSPDFPVQNPVRSFHGGGPSGLFDAFVTKFDPSGTSLVFSTYLGEPNYAWGEAIALDASGSIHVGGRTDLTAVPDENAQAYLASLSADGSAIEFSTTLGGAGIDAITDLKVDATGDLWAVGHTTSTDFPAVGGSYQPVSGGGYDAFLLRYSSGASPNPAGVLQLASGYGSDERAGPTTVTVGRIGGREGEVTVDYSTSPGTALTPWDYTPVSGTLVFPDGAGTSSFTVPVFHNQIRLGDRTFSVSLANPTGGASLGRSTAPVTIHEADADQGGLSATFRIRDRLLATGPAWNASTSVPWITLSSYSGTGPSVVTATVSPTGLHSGDHDGYIYIWGDAAGSPLVVPVRLSITCGEGC